MCLVLLTRLLPSSGEDAGDAASDDDDDANDMDVLLLLLLLLLLLGLALLLLCCDELVCLGLESAATPCLDVGDFPLPTSFENKRKEKSDTNQWW